MIAAAREHVITPEMFFELGFFPNVEVAARRFEKLTEQELLRFCGFVTVSPEKPKQKAYTAGWIAKANQVEHEFWLTIALFLLRPNAIQRRKVNEKLKPDAHVWFNKSDGPTELLIELDRGTEKKPQFQRRLKKLAKHPTIWICHADKPAKAERRMHWMREINRELAAPHLFTTTYKLMQVPRELWTSWQQLEVSNDVS